MTTKEQAPGAPAAFAEPSLLPQHPHRILVAEDEHLVAANLTQILAEMGYVVVGPVADGEAAANLARLAVPDLALLDIRMPKRDGLSVAKELLTTLGIPSIMISAYADPDYVRSAEEAGAFSYLVKPVQDDQLRVTIGVAWQQYRRYATERAESETLRRKLDERKIIEQAKWILVSRRSITEPEALKLLQSQARESRQTLAEVARAVINAQTLL